MTQSPTIARPTDAQLIAQFAATRDEAAFRELVSRHLNWVYGVARRHTRDAALAEDVTQGVFLALSAKSQKLVGHRHLAGWLFEAARLGASSALRQRARQKERERMAAQNQNLPAMSDLERLELADQLDAAVSRLSAPERTVILARFYEQVDTAEIARRLNTTPAAAKKRIERAIEKLRERMNVQKPAEAFASAVAGTTAVIAPQHLGAAVLAGKSTPAALGISASIQWLLGLGAKLLWITTTVVCITAAIGTVTAVATTRAHRTPLPALIPIATTTPPAPLPADITGDVSGPDGKPLANVDVIIPTYNEGGRAIAARTRTNASGQFFFPHGTDLRYLFAFVPNVGISKSASPDDLPVHLQLLPAVDAEITLLAPGGGPAPGVTLQPHNVSIRNDASPLPAFVLIPDEIAPLFSGTTDASGKCTIRGLPRDTRIWFDTTDARFAHLAYTQQVDLQGDGPAIAAKPMHLRKAATVRGRLLNPETGAPVPGLELGAQATNGTEDAVGDTSVTDANGNFAISRVTPGDYIVSLGEHDNKSNDWTAAAVEVAVLEGDDKTIDMKLTRGGFLKGQVRDATTGKPIPSAQVGLYGTAKPKSAASIYGRTTDAQGRFEFRVPPGEQDPYLSGTVDGYLQPKNQGMQNVTVREGQTTIVNFDLQPDPNPLVDGTVIGPDGQPVPGATVLYNADDSPFGQSTKTDAHGHFRVHAKPGMTVHAQWKDLATSSSIAIVDNSPLELNLEPNPTFTLIVRLLDQDGTPLTDGQANITVWSGIHGIGGSIPRHADADGRILFESLKKDTHYSVDGKAPGYGTASKDLKKIQLNGRKEVTVTLRPQKATAVIAGVVIDQDDHPVPNIHVVMNGTDLQEQRSDAQGRFSFPVVPGQSGLVYIRTDKGENLQAVEARADGKEIKLLLPHE